MSAFNDPTVDCCQRDAADCDCPSWPSIPDGPYPLGKYSTLRDEYLHMMAIDGWANESTGDVSSPTGFVWLISNAPAEMLEITQVFGPAPINAVGHFVLIEDSNGFVSVYDYSTKIGAETLFRALEAEYDVWSAWEYADEQTAEDNVWTNEDEGTQRDITVWGV